MVIRRGLAVLSGLALLLSWPGVAAACSGPPPRAEDVGWSAGDTAAATALLAPEGAVISLDSDGRSRRAWHLWGDLNSVEAGLSADGSTLVYLRQHYDPDSPSCTPARVDVFAVEVATGQRRRLGRLGLEGAYVTRVLVSPTGHHVAIRAGNYDEEVVDLFDVTTARRLRMVSAEGAHWLDDDHLACVSPEEHAIRFIRASDGETVATYARAEEDLSLPGEQPPGAALTAFGLGASTTALVRLSLEGGELSAERRSWPAAAGSSDGIRAVTADGRLAARSSRPGRRPGPYHERDNVVEVIDLETGGTRLRIVGRAAYTYVSFSPDGRHLALVSHAPSAIAGDGDSEADSPAALEVVDLESGRVVAAGAAGRSVVSAPE